MCNYRSPVILSISGYTLAPWMGLLTCTGVGALAEVTLVGFMSPPTGSRVGFLLHEIMQAPGIKPGTS
jgi:hypothetical protein